MIHEIKIPKTEEALQELSTLHGDRDRFVEYIDKHVPFSLYDIVESEEVDDGIILWIDVIRDD